jgi:hypothetical protein
MDWDHDHILHLGNETDAPADPGSNVTAYRKRIEPWLSSVFQAEHLSLLVGNGFSSAIASVAGVRTAGMAAAKFGCVLQDKVEARAKRLASAGARGEPNIEDLISAALELHTGLTILDHPDCGAWDTAINRMLAELAGGVLATERGIKDHLDQVSTSAGFTPREALVSFLMSFASRAASRERLHIFTTNYDRLVERGCDLAGLRIIDRFIGAIEPEFRSSRLQIDMHYLPPGIRGEPRQLEGVVRLTKLHGSLDWRSEGRRFYRTSMPFGAENSHPSLPANPRQSVLIYPNAAKDSETGNYPYADLFRDFSAAVCQPNSVLVTYGYGFGDDHVNRVIADMLTIPSCHLVIIAWGDQPHSRIASFVERVGRPPQITLILGRHFGDLANLVRFYLPKPAIDPLTIRMTELIERRGKGSDLSSGDPLKVP